MINHPKSDSPTLAGHSKASSCRGAIRAAHGVVRDIGQEAAKSSRGLLELSRCSQKNSERDVERVSRQYKLQLPVPMRELQKSPGVRYMGTFHVIALEDWMQFIVDHNLFHILCGLNQPDHKRERAILREFWKLYRAANPNHQMWDMIDRHNIQLSRLAPMLLHGDEGRGRKKMPFLITSYHSMIGFGTTLANEQRKQRLYLQLRLNYSGSSHTTRMISGCLPKMTKDEVALKDLLSFTAGDCMRTFQTGVANQEGERYHAICLNAVGDWMWLAKAANLQRSFANVPKQALVPTSVPKGICHYCHAGQTNYDFEDLGFNPAWKRTMFLPGDQPWKSRPALLDLPHDPSKPAAFFSFDIWHAFHLGLGKVFVASALACISDLFRGTNIDARFLELTDLYLQWCDENRTPAYIIGITKETCGWFDRKTYPNGQWHKGHITTTLLRFLESWFSKNDVSQDAILSCCKDATLCVNRCFHRMYASDLWLERDLARSIGGDGMEFLCQFQRLAHESFNQGKALFPYLPKTHIVHHTMLECCDTVCTTLSPLAFGVQVDEDFIGKKSRLARRVAPTQVILRVLQRSLQVAYAYWHEAGFIKG